MTYTYLYMVSDMYKTFLWYKTLWFMKASINRNIVIMVTTLIIVAMSGFSNIDNYDNYHYNYSW